MSTQESPVVAYGDTVLFVTKDRKTFIRTISPGGRFQCHHGTLDYDDIVGKPMGLRMQTHLGHGIWVLAPNMDDIIKHLKRESQIIFPKDLGYILMKLGIQPGVRVVEAGTGSGGLTLTLATMIGEAGHVYSYDRRGDMQTVARRNLERVGLADRVTFTERDITLGLDQRGVDAVFLDVPKPWEHLAVAHAALKGGGFLGCIVPTMNQVVELNQVLHDGPWFFVQIEELLLRSYKIVPARVRPDDQMVGHTGYLVFARALVELPTDDPDSA